MLEWILLDYDRNGRREDSKTTSMSSGSLDSRVNPEPPAASAQENYQPVSSTGNFISPRLRLSNRLLEACGKSKALRLSTTWKCSRAATGSMTGQPMPIVAEVAYSSMVGSKLDSRSFISQVI